MSPPHNKNLSRPEFPGQSQTMFYIENQTLAVLVTFKDRKEVVTNPRYKTPGQALAWCVKNRCNFVYRVEPPNN